MENKEIRLTVHLTEKDYLKFQTDHIGTLKSKKWWIYGAIVLIIVLFINISGFIANGFSGISLTSFIPLIIFVTVILISVFSIRAKVKSSFKSDPTLHHPMDIIINDQGLSLKAYRTNSDPLWEDIYRYSITKDTIYIYTAENKSVIIPKRVFENESDLNIVTQLLINKVDLKRHKKQASKIRYKSWLLAAAIFICIFSYSIFEGSGKREKQSQALEFEKKGNYKSAAEIYSQLIIDNPNEDSNYGYRAKCEIELSEYKAAITDCEKAISLQPSGWTYYTYAYALYYDERYKDACLAIKKSIEMGYTQENEGLCDPPEN